MLSFFMFIFLLNFIIWEVRFFFCENTLTVKVAFPKSWDYCNLDEVAYGKLWELRNNTLQRTSLFCHETSRYKEPLFATKLQRIRNLFFVRETTHWKEPLFNKTTQYKQPPFSTKLLSTKKLLFVAVATKWQHE